MDKAHSPGSMVILLCVILVFSLTALFEKMIEISFGEERIRSDRRIRQREQERHKTEKIAGNYEEKIRMMAESFEKMSKSIDGFDRLDRLHGGGRQFSGELGVINEIWQRKLEESRSAVALQLKEMSGILKDVTEDSYVFVSLSPEKEKCLRRKLKQRGIQVKNVVILNNRRGIDEVNIILKAGKQTVTLKETAEIISRVLGKPLPSGKTRMRPVAREYHTYTFMEEPNFFVIHGAAKRASEGLEVSGDNFTCMELDSGQTLVSVSDGMGHGKKAYRESEMVMELLEEMMKGGFSEEAAVRLINSVFTIDSDVTSPGQLSIWGLSICIPGSAIL